MALTGEQLNLLFRARGDTSDAKKAFNELRQTINVDLGKADKYFDESTLRWRNSLGQFVKGAEKNIAELTNKLKSQRNSFGSGLQSIGKSLTVGLTAPLLALGAASVSSASNLDSLRNNLVSATGSVDAANKKIAELKKLSQESAGVLVDFAADTYSLLKPLKLAEPTIEAFTKALGKIKLQAPDLNVQDFSQNINQLFNQDFERGDLKELVGKFPRIGELLQKQFELKGSDLNSLSEGFKKLKAQGKLSIEDFYKGVADSVNNDESLSLLSDTISIRFSKAFERVNLALAPLGDAILKQIEPLIPKIISLIEYLSDAFISLSPAMQTLVIAIGAIAAAVGPVLIAIGGLIGFFAPLIAAIASAGGVSAVFASAMAAVVPVLSALAPIIAAVVVAIAAIGAAAAAVYVIWQTNFGGLRDFTISAFEKIKTVFSETFGFLRRVAETVLNAITQFWNEHYDEIRQVVNTVSNAIKNTISAFLETVQRFWTAHGASILKYVDTYWNAIKSIVAGVLDVIGKVISVALKLFNGDFEGAFDALLKLVTSATKLSATILRGFFNVVVDLFKALIPIIIDYGLKIIATLREYITKAVTTAIGIFATLPQRLLALIPLMIKAGLSIGSAILQGIRDAFTQNPVVIEPEVGDPNRTQKVIDYSQPKTEAAQAAQAASPIDEKELEKQRKKREAAYQKELDLQAKYNSILLSQEKESFNAVQKQVEDDFAKRIISQEQFENESLQNINTFSTRAKQILTDIFNLESKGKAGSELKNLQLEFGGALKELERDRLEKTNTVQKTLTDAVKTETEKREKITQKEIQNETALREAAIKKVIAQREAAAISEKDLIQLKQGLNAIFAETDKQPDYKNKANFVFQVLEDGKTKNIEVIEGLLKFKKDKLLEELKSVKGNAEEEARITQELAQLKEEVETAYYQQRKENADSAKKTAEEEKQAAKDLLQIKQEILKAERDILDFRADQERKRLNNVVDFSLGQNRIDGLIKLRDFEISENNRRRQEDLADAKREKDATLAKIEDLEKEKEKVDEINTAYERRLEIINEIYDKKNDNINIESKPQIEKEQAIDDGGFLGAFTEGIAGYLEQIALVKDANDQLQFSFEKVFSSIAEIGLNAFSSLAQGFGQLIGNWVLYGNAGGQTLQKLTASILAQVATTAATYAIMCLAAAAFATTAFGAAILGGTPAQFLKAAAIFGIIAVGSALVGRAVAGNSFANKQSQNAFAGNNAASQHSNTGQKNGGSVYSSYGEKAETVNFSRNTPEGAGENTAGIFDQTLTLKIETVDSHIISVVKEDLKNFGSLRRQTVEIIESR